MYKVLVVDDEALVREAIMEQMPWASLGYDCIGGCEDGVEALERVEAQPPDLVLTDISMPFMDGLELTRELSRQHPSVRVIILTGFDDFEYARQAVQLQAYDFILKPVTAQELGVVLQRLRDELDAERRQRQHLEHLQQQLHESLPLLRERFLERLVTGAPLGPLPELEARCRHYGVALHGPCFIELAMDVDGLTLERPPAGSDEELLRFALYNIAQELAETRPGTAVFRDSGLRVMALLSGPEPEGLAREAHQLAGSIREAVRSYLPLKMTVGIGHACRGLQELQLAHSSALSALQYRFVIGTGEVILLSDLERRERPPLLSTAGWEQDLLTRLKTGSAAEMDVFIAQLFASFRQHVYPVEACQLYIQRLLWCLMSHVYELEGERSEVFGQASEALTALGRFSNLQDLEAWMQGLCRQAVTRVHRVREDFCALQIAEAERYVSVLKQVCARIAMSSSYFSTLFKTRTGLTFTEYVTRERMEKAKELLGRTDLRSFEVAHRVGYSDPHYFSGAFKKYTGAAPTEYREQCQTGKCDSQ